MCRGGEPAHVYACLRQNDLRAAPCDPGHLANLRNGRLELRHVRFRDPVQLLNAFVQVADMVEDMRRNHLTLDDIAYVVPHQANLRIIEAVADKAGVPMDKVLVNIQHTGNTSAASIPICLDEYKDRLKKGDKIILTAFGAGFTWGAMYLVWDM